MLSALQSSWTAHTIAQSQMLTAGLSAVHLLGFTLVMGSAVVSNLRMLGAVFLDQPATAITRPASRALLLGACVSVTTGFLLFLPRAVGASRNDFFRVKILLLVAAALFHLVVQRRVAATASAAPGLSRMVGAVGLALWLGLAVAAGAFILIE